ncbi:hypothetical protein ACFO1B_50140 [Dactylosporangium siamense]|uniref:hypothetical protein n=1 Tax=Dactylosporangium siamense TaxID=685454 RepID=UPI0019448A56|nr:hypothetical protein [Dactylosporangium siamense]
MWLRFHETVPDIVRDAEQVSVGGYERISTRLDNDSSFRTYWLGPESVDVTSNIHAPSLILGPPTVTGLPGFTALAEGKSTVDGKTYAVYIEELDLAYWNSGGRTVPIGKPFGLDSSQSADVNSRQLRFVSVIMLA